MRRRGFTLIELLVVIAIIAVLAAILFPVFTKAQNQAKFTACMSNAKQIGNGLMLYVQDNSSCWPCMDAFMREYQGKSAYDVARVMTYGYGGMPWLLKKYTKSERVFWCPVDKANNPFRDFPSEWDRQKNWASLIYRWCLAYYTDRYNGNNDAKMLRDSAFVRPGKTVALHEIKSYHFTQQWCWVGSAEAQRTNPPILVAIYADGHAGKWRLLYKNGQGTPYDANWMVNGNKMNASYQWDPSRGWDN